MTRSRERAAITVVRHRRLWLVGRRSATQALAGLWEFPGGKLQPKETPESAARRECLEETGLAVQVVQLLDHYKHAYPHLEVELWFFLCRLENDLAAPVRPPYRFVTWDQLLTLEMPSANRPIIQRLQTLGQDN